MANRGRLRMVENSSFIHWLPAFYTFSCQGKRLLAPAFPINAEGIVNLIFPGSGLKYITIYHILTVFPSVLSPKITQQQAGSLALIQ